MRRRGWSCQRPARRAVERDDGAVGVWPRETWPRAKKSLRPQGPGSSSRTRPGLSDGP
ncbi:winged helix-turn-helix domain-containing protein [Frankia sp. KB5]|uniref:winged helix-turn-helix domain-containing protein n=1 Tax=Frankia sp. KB5 TaxID=683318 RepID=UPI001F53AEF9|nr:winged helix-turn-helix domain-containing protein [Frankia sp. KB5]